MLILVKFTLYILALISNLSFAACLKSSSCKGTVTFSTGKRLTYYRSHPLGTKNSSVTSAVIMIHGTERNADSYFDYTAQAIGSDRYAVFAPYFADTYQAGYHYWSTSGWRKGDGASDDASMSSYKIIDEMIVKISSSYPNARKLVIAGHSAGGQFVDRYAAGGIDSPRSNLRIDYVAMNPSSWFYLSSDRPFDTTLCMFFNFYHYGIEAPNAYMTGKDYLGNYSKRKLFILVGSLDTKADSGLDQTCLANAQGKNRLERARYYFQHVKTFPSWYANTRYYEIAGVGHSASKMIQNASRIVFGG